MEAVAVAAIAASAKTRLYSVSFMQKMKYVRSCTRGENGWGGAPVLDAAEKNDGDKQWLEGRKRMKVKYISQRTTQTDNVMRDEYLLLPTETNCKIFKTSKHFSFLIHSCRIFFTHRPEDSLSVYHIIIYTFGKRYERYPSATEMMMMRKRFPWDDGKEYGQHAGWMNELTDGGETNTSVEQHFIFLLFFL